MHRSLHLSLPTLLALLCAAPAASATVLWNEMTNGDFSGERLTPTPLTLSLGDNELFGIVGGNPGMGDADLDYFRITVPAGLQLSGLFLDFYESPDLVAFLGIQAGPIFTVDPVDASDELLLGWTHFGPSQVGQDLLPLMGAHGTGFTPPLPAGTYTFWAQQLDDYTDLTGRFVVTEIPAPASAMSLIVCGAACASRRRRI